MNCIVPKHKSFLKQSDLYTAQKPSAEEVKAREKKEKEKTAVDIMFKMVVREHNAMEQEDRRVYDE